MESRPPWDESGREMAGFDEHIEEGGGRKGGVEVCTAD
jgi:hypothetical protein